MKNGGPYPDHVPSNGSGGSLTGGPPIRRELEASVAKHHPRPSAQYRYEHYDPTRGA
jgi:hypothetical protein